MIPLLSRARSRIADMLNARTLAQTVRILSRQLDHAHLAGQIEEARADRAEERVAELEAETRDWREASGELVAEQAADLPDLEPADDSGPPSPLPADPYARAEVQAKRADAAERHRLAAEAHAADLESELATVRAQLQQTERAAGAHLATIDRLQEQIAAAHRAAHAPARSLRDRADNARAAWEAAPHTPEDDGLAWQAVVRACDTSAAPAEQIPGVLASAEVCDACRRPTFDGERTGEAEAVLLCGRCRATAEREEAGRAAARELPCQCGHERDVHGREGCAAVVHGSVCRCERFQVYGRDPVEPPDSNAGRLEADLADAADTPPETQPSARLTATAGVQS